MEEKLKIALAQVAPVWLQKKATLMKAEKYVLEAARAECELIVLVKALYPVIPFGWRIPVVPNLSQMFKKTYMLIT